MREVGHVACCHWCLNRARTGSGGSGHGTKALCVAADGHKGSSERRGRNGRKGACSGSRSGSTCLFDGCHAVRSLHIGGLGAQVSHTARRMLCIWGPSERTEVPDTEVCWCVCVCVCYRRTKLPVSDLIHPQTIRKSPNYKL